MPMNTTKPSLLAKTSTLLVSCGLLLALASGCTNTKPAACPAPWPAARLLPANHPDPNWLDHDRSQQ